MEGDGLLPSVYLLSCYSYVLFLYFLLLLVYYNFYICIIYLGQGAEVILRLEELLRMYESTPPCWNFGWKLLVWVKIQMSEAAVPHLALHMSVQTETKAGLLLAHIKASADRRSYYRAHWKPF